MRRDVTWVPQNIREGKRERGEVGREKARKEGGMRGEMRE